MNAVVPGAWPPRAGPANGSADMGALGRVLGAQLRNLREAVEVTPEQAAVALRSSPAAIARMEAGGTGLALRDVAALLALYSMADGQGHPPVLDFARQSARSGWWADYGAILPDWLETFIGLESTADTIRSCDVQFVNVLFQTEDYARAVTKIGHRSASSGEIEDRVTLRLRRQDLLTRPSPPKIWSVMDESVLRRPVGNPAVLRAQLRRLVDLTAMPRVCIQVVPFTRAGQAGESGSFSLLRLGVPDLPDIVRIEHLTSAVYLATRPDLERYLEVLDNMCWHALTPAASKAFIEQAAQQV